MKNTILVAGGMGYIGSHTCVELIENGYNVLIIDDLSNSSPEVLDRIKKITGIKPDFLELDLCDFKRLEEYIKNYERIDAIIHFAAHKYVGESVQDPLKYYDNNLISLLNTLKIMNIYSIKNIVFSSSCTVYGQPDNLPVDENTPNGEAQSPYAHTKQMCEQIIKDVSCSYEHINSILLRYFNPIGAHESSLIGQRPNGIPESLVPYITQTAIGLREELKVYGDTYNTPDGTCIRDYIHIQDLANAHLIAVNRLINGDINSPAEVFNLGTGRGNSVLDVIKSFEEVSGEKLNFKIVEKREGDIEKIFANTDLAASVLRWKTERTLDESLLSAWNWEKKCKDIHKE